MAYGQPTTSFNQRRALGIRYGQDPALTLEQQRMEQEYIAQPARAANAQRIQEMNLLDQRRQEAIDRQGRASMINAGGNVVSMGMQAAKMGKDMGWWGNGKPVTPTETVPNPNNLPIYDKNNPIPVNNDIYTQQQYGYDVNNPMPQNSMTTNNYPGQGGVQGGMYDNPIKTSYDITPSAVDIGQPDIMPVSPETPNAPSGFDTAMGIGGSGVGAVSSAYNAANAFGRGDTLSGGLYTAKGIVDAASGINKGVNAINSIGNTVNAAGQTVDAAGKVVSNTTSSLGSALPIAGAAINVGLGAKDVATAPTLQKGVAGVWKMVDGVLQYVIPQYGAGRAASGLVDAGLGLAGQANNRVANDWQNIFDPAGMANRGKSSARSLFGKDD